MTNNSGEFDGLIKCCVEEFNSQIEEAATFHRQMLKVLCAERIRQDFDETYSPPVRIRTIRSRRLAPVVGSMLQQVGREMGRRILPKRRNLAHRSNKQPDVIEGEFVVLSDEISQLSNTGKDKE